MWRNVKAAALNATFQFLVIYGLCITVMTITNENTINGLLLGNIKEFDKSKMFNLNIQANFIFPFPSVICLQNFTNGSQIKRKVAKESYAKIILIRKK